MCVSFCTLLTENSCCWEQDPELSNFDLRADLQLHLDLH